VNSDADLRFTLVERKGNRCVVSAGDVLDMGMDRLGSFVRLNLATQIPMSSALPECHTSLR